MKSVSHCLRQLRLASGKWHWQHVPSAKMLPLLKNMLRRLTNWCLKQVDTLKLIATWKNPQDFFSANDSRRLSSLVYAARGCILVSRDHFTYHKVCCIDDFANWRWGVGPYVVRGLTDRPTDVFDAAKRLFIHQYQLTVHQRLSQAFAMGGIQVVEKPSQWTARFRHVWGEWDREAVERWALFRQLPTALRTALEAPTPQLTNKADDLFATVPRDTVASVDTHITAAVFAGTRVKRRVMSNESDKHNAGKAKQLCWYHRMFGEKSRFCNGPPCHRHHPSLPKGRTTESRSAEGNP